MRRLCIDASFENLWGERQLTPAPLAPPLAVARRMSLALQGTIPSLEEIDSSKARPATIGCRRGLPSCGPIARMADDLANVMAGLRGGRRWSVPAVSTPPVRELARGPAGANEPYDRLVRHLIADSGLSTTPRPRIS